LEEFKSVLLKFGRIDESALASGNAFPGRGDGTALVLWLQTKN
jgi:hypothetical protein